jgi:hypothetical protein
MWYTYIVHDWTIHLRFDLNVIDCTSPKLQARISTVCSCQKVCKEDNDTYLEFEDHLLTSPSG